MICILYAHNMTESILLVNIITPSLHCFIFTSCFVLFSRKCKSKGHNCEYLTIDALIKDIQHK